MRCRRYAILPKAAAEQKFWYNDRGNLHKYIGSNLISLNFAAFLCATEKLSSTTFGLKMVQCPSSHILLLFF